MSRPPRDNTEAEIDDFADICGRLGGFDSRLSAEWVDGYLSALAAGPVALPLASWLPKMAGDTYDRAFADPDDRARAEGALGARATVLADQLDPEPLLDDPDRLRLSPLMLAWDDDLRAQAVADGEVDAGQAPSLVTGSEWAAGFFAALEDFGPTWPQVDDEEERAFVDDLHAQVLALGLAEGSAELRRHLQARYGEEGADRDRLVDDACYAVQDLRVWWLDHAPRPETRRVGKLPGRNDPCPCGSGRKFKKCHGSA